MKNHLTQELATQAPHGGSPVTTSGFCAACDSYFVDAAAYRFDAPDGIVLVEARHYATSERPAARGSRINATERDEAPAVCGPRSRSGPGPDPSAFEHERDGAADLAAVAGAGEGAPLGERDGLA